MNEMFHWMAQGRSTLGDRNGLWRCMYWSSVVLWLALGHLPALMWKMNCAFPPLRSWSRQVVAGGTVRSTPSVRHNLPRRLSSTHS